MTRDIISASPEDHILDILHILENFEISAMPVVDDGDVVGIISNDILAQKALTGLLQAQG
jgi:predicted transcriptional regulator